MNDGLQYRVDNAALAHLALKTAIILLQFVVLSSKQDSPTPDQGVPMDRKRPCLHKSAFRGA